MSEASRTLIGAAARQHLVNLGWNALRAPALAKKAFETAVGEKFAIVYLANWPGEGCSLTAQYLSEGRNILAPLQSELLDPATTEAAVRRLAADVDAAVDQSYARGLYLRHGLTS